MDHWTTPAGLKYLGPHQDDSPLTVTLVLRRRAGANPVAAAWPQLPRWRRGADFGGHCGAQDADLASLRNFAQRHGLAEMGADAQRRVLHLRGGARALEAAFGVALGRYRFGAAGEEFVGVGHAPVLPPEAIAVLGLDRRPVAQPRLRYPRGAPAVSYTPLQLGQLYGFPAGTDGGGECVAIIELGGGYSQADLTHYFHGLGLTRIPKLTAVEVAGGANKPGGAADGEVMLDVEIIGALAPAASIVVYFAPNTDQGFYEAVSQAVHDTVHKPSVISISWGGPEGDWTGPSRSAMETALQDAAALAVTVTAASGDSGSDDGVGDSQPHVDYPAASQWVLGCGGTRLLAAGDRIASEVVWNETASGEGATGGGISRLFAVPAWQQRVSLPAAPGGGTGRGVPDVAGNADPLTGYQVRVDGKDQVIGGTSAVAPLWAALLARCNQKLDRAVGDVHAALYENAAGTFHDITQGNNGAWRAAPGWDACTGLGTPNGTALLGALAALKP
ncbi:MAG: peptidase S53 [Proteobacteria bacterium]|nr:peptidase S53 [Pseudomonadota bacterium]